MKREGIRYISLSVVDKFLQTLRRTKWTLKEPRTIYYTVYRIVIVYESEKI